MRYALVAPAILAVTALAAPVPNQDGLIGTVDAAVNLRDADITGTAKRSEDLTIDDLSVKNLDVPPNVNIKNIPRSEDLSVKNVIPLGLGVPTIVRRGDGNGEQEDDGDKGLLGLDLLGILKRDDSLLTDGDDDILGLGILKRDDSLLTDGDQNDDGDEGLLGLDLLGILKRDGSLLTDGDNDLLGLGVSLKRDNSLATDGDAANGDNLLGGDGLLGVDLLKRKEETSVVGIGGVDIGSPVIDAVNV